MRTSAEAFGAGAGSAALVAGSLVEAAEASFAGGASGGEAAPPDSRGIRYEVGDNGKVAFIHAGGPSIQYVEGCL